MAIVVGDSLKVSAEKPLDSRQVVNTLADVELYKYEGMVVFDKSDSKVKVCVKGALEDVLEFVELQQVQEAVVPQVPAEVAGLGIAKVYGNNDDYGTAKEAAANCCSHGFIELYNRGTEPAPIEGLSLRIVNPKAALVHELKLAADDKNKAFTKATKIAPQSSYLIRCKETVWKTYGDPMSVAVAAGGTFIVDADAKSLAEEEVMADQECPELFVKEGMQIALVAANGAVIDTFFADDLGKTKIAVRKSNLIIETEKLLEVGGEDYAPRSSLDGVHKEVFRYEPVDADASAVVEAKLVKAVKAVVALGEKTESALAVVEGLMVPISISGDHSEEYVLDEAKVMGETVMTTEKPSIDLDLLGTQVPMVCASQAEAGADIKIAAPLLFLAKNPVKITLKDADFASTKLDEVKTNGAITKLTAETVAVELVNGAEGDVVSVDSISKKGYANLQAVVAAKETEDRVVKIALPGLMVPGDKVMMRLGDGEQLLALKVVEADGEGKVQVALDGLALSPVEHEIVLAVVREDSVVKVDIKLIVKRPEVAQA